jgi:NAD(P)-dependent dehydrogenase (short-subunit alcohol dehydrogenase family)
VAIVTGGSFGGRVNRSGFAKRAKVVVVDWKENTETIDLIKKSGGEALFIKCDVSKSSDVKDGRKQLRLSGD